MKKTSFILILLCLVVFISCKKQDDNTQTKVGFYYADTSLLNNELNAYNLFLDNDFKGKISNLKYTPTCGDSNLLYLTLDGKRHEVDIKNDAGEYINSEYIQIEENKCGSGSGKNSKNVKGGMHGSSVSKRTGDDCATMCFIK